jgi:PAS domain S-box-containing protein
MTPTYSFNVYALPPAVTAIGFLLVGVAVLIRERASRLSTALLFVQLAVSLWLCGLTAMYCATNEAVAMWWARFHFLAIPFMPSTIYLASVVVMGIYARRKRLIWAGLLVSAFFSAAALGSDAMVAGVHRYWWGYYPRYGWLGIPFLVFFFGLALANLRDYWVEYRKAEPGTHKLRLRALLIAFNFAYLGSFDYLPCYGVDLYPFGYLPVFVCLALTARVAQRYQLIDIVPAFAANEIIATMADPLAVCDADRRIRVVNEALCATLGYTQQELLGEPVERLAGADAGGVERLRQLLLPGTAREEEMVLRTRAGDPVTVSVSLSPLQGGGRNRLGTVLIARDIREQKRAEAQLLQANTFLDSIVENIPDMVFVKDAKNLRFLLFNRAGEELLGYTRADLIGRNDYDFFPKEEADFFTEKDRAVLHDKTLLDIPHEPISTGQRGERILHTKKIPILDDKGEPAYLLGISEDVTERRHAEETKQRHAHETKILSDILSALNEQQDATKAFPVVGAELHKLSGCDSSGLALFDVDNDWLTLCALGPGDIPVEPGARLQVADMPGAKDVLSGRSHVVADLASQLDFPLVRLAYAQGYRSSMALPLHGSGGISGMLGLLWRRHGGLNEAQVPLLGQVADALALAVEKSRLFEQVSAARQRLQMLAKRLMEVQETERRHIARELHDEIGQHLTGINLVLGTVDHLSAEGAVTRLKEVHALVDGLIARVRDVSLDLRPAMLDDFGVLTALSWLFDRYTTQTGIKVAFQHCAMQQRFAAEQETAVYRIVQEALTNVARHAGVGSVKVDAWADGGILGVSITDQGAGFDVDAVLANGMTGGLAGLRERAMLLGGRLTVESKPGAGTRLIAELPLSSGPRFHVEVGE